MMRNDENFALIKVVSLLLMLFNMSKCMEQGTAENIDYQTEDQPITCFDKIDRKLKKITAKIKEQKHIKKRNMK